MEDMDIQQTPFPDQEHENSKRCHVEDDNSSYPSKREKFSYPYEKRPMRFLLRWSKIVNFVWYTELDVKVYEDIIDECKKEIKACEFAFQESEESFNSKFKDLEKKHPDYWSTNVVRSFNSLKETTRICLFKANQLFPGFEDHVKAYIKFREGPLQNFLDAKDRRTQKLKELAEKPKVEKLLIKIYNDEDNENGDHTKPSRMDFLFIHFSYRGSILNVSEDAKSEEQDDESKKEELLLQGECETFKKDLIILQEATEKASDDFKKCIEENQRGVYDFMYPLEENLGVVDSKLRIMHRQLKLLVEKDVIRNGYRSDFSVEWRKVSYPAIDMIRN